MDNSDVVDNNDSDFSAVKITNPLWIGEALTQHIEKFLLQVDIPTIDHQTLYAHLVNIVQYGGDDAELWVVLDDEQSPVAFATWRVGMLPTRGTVCCDYMYSWNRMHKPVSLLLDEYIKFGRQHNCPLYTASLVAPPLYRVFNKAATSKGMILDKKDYIYVIGRKK
jgi:hypothetical protein